MLWVKAFHIIFMVAWFAGIFYLPRLFVNHAMAEHEAEKERLALMERKLYRFITPWMLLTLAFGFWLSLDYAWAAYSGMWSLHLKLLLVALLVAYHFYCGKIIRDLAENRCRRRFTQLIVQGADDETMRDGLRQRYGDRGLIELSFAIASAKIPPTVKRALGYAQSCTEVSIHV